MKVEIGLAHKDARQHLLAAVEGAPYPVTLTAQNHAPSHLFVKFYMAGAGNVGSTVTHTFTRRDEIARWVTDLEQIARQNNYACICSVDLDIPEPQQPDPDKEQKPQNDPALFEPGSHSQEHHDQTLASITSQETGANPESTQAASEATNTVTDTVEKKPVGHPPKTATTPEGCLMSLFVRQLGEEPAFS